MIGVDSFFWWTRCVLISALVLWPSESLLLAQTSFDRRTDSAPAPLGSGLDCEQRHFDQCSQTCAATAEGLAQFRCLRNCLSQECAPTQGTDFSIPDSPRECVRQKSLVCVGQCKQEESSIAARCRRSCLSSGCQDADAFELAKEAQTPGYIDCEICKEQFDGFCRDVCLSSSSGRAALACKVSCQRLRCADSCKFSLSSGSTGVGRW